MSLFLEICSPLTLVVISRTTPQVSKTPLPIMMGYMIRPVTSILFCLTYKSTWNVLFVVFLFLSEQITSLHDTFFIISSYSFDFVCFLHNDTLFHVCLLSERHFHCRVDGGYHPFFVPLYTFGHLIRKGPSPLSYRFPGLHLVRMTHTSFTPLVIPTSRRSLLISPPSTMGVPGPRHLSAFSNVSET